MQRVADEMENKCFVYSKHSLHLGRLPWFQVLITGILGCSKKGQEKESKTKRDREAVDGGGSVKSRTGIYQAKNKILNRGRMGGVVSQSKTLCRFTSLG